MAPKFGTSGLRGLVTELTGDLVGRHVQAFAAACNTGGTLYVGRDLRASSPHIAADVIAAAQTAGCDTVDCGALPTPALALAAQEAGAGAIMVTGSHIPDDRNGLKFYSRAGEITKADEAAIREGLDRPHPAAAPGTGRQDNAAATRFAARYLAAFGPAALAGRRIGVYAHSAVGRDLLAQVLAGLGAEVVELGRADRFIPVDTEAVDPDTRTRLADWAGAQPLDAIVSTDGDSDRPLVTDAEGQVVPGDILGQITAEYLGAETVVTPVSSNSGVTQKGFARVHLTQIGSPFVIAAMQAAGGRVAGYEANGGFLLGFKAAGPTGPLPPLMTRDSLLPILVPLVAAGSGSLAARVAAEPPVVTRADRLQEVPASASGPFIATLREDPEARAEFLTGLGEAEHSLDLTDGLRLHLASGGVLHIRPSGNAPELRLYVEGTDAAAAEDLLRRAMAEVGTRLAG